MESVSKTGGGMEPSAILAVIAGALMLAGGILALSMFSIWSRFVRAGNRLWLAKLSRSGL